MTTFELKTRTQKIALTKDGKLRKDLRTALVDSGIRTASDKLYPMIQYGSGKWITYNDKTHNITNILKSQGYSWKTGNDAPRGGKLGNYIKLSSRAMAFLVWLYVEYS